MPPKHPTNNNSDSDFGPHSTESATLSPIASTSNSPISSSFPSGHTSYQHGPPYPIPSELGQSPSASAFLRTTQTLEELAQQLDRLNSSTGEGRGSGSDASDDHEDGGVEARLALSAEIGAALLQRCEALEKKHDFEVKRYEYQVSIGFCEGKNDNSASACLRSHLDTRSAYLLGFMSGVWKHNRS